MRTPSSSHAPTPSASASPTASRRAGRSARAAAGPGRPRRREPPYLPEREHDSRYDDEPDDAIYAPGDGLDPYRSLLDACRDGKLVRPGGSILIQFHGRPLAADCWQLEDLRAQLENGE